MISDSQKAHFHSKNWVIRIFKKTGGNYDDSDFYKRI